MSGVKFKKGMLVEYGLNGELVVEVISVEDSLFTGKVVTDKDNTYDEDQVVDGWNIRAFKPHTNFSELDVVKHIDHDEFLLVVINVPTEGDCFKAMVLQPVLEEHPAGHVSEKWMKHDFVLHTTKQEQEIEHQKSVVYGEHIKKRVQEVISHKEDEWGGLEIGDTDHEGNELSVSIMYYGLEVVVVSEHPEIPVRYCTIDTKGNTPQELHEAMTNYFGEEFVDYPAINTERCFRMGLHSDIPVFEIKKEVVEKYSVNIKDE